MTVEVRVLGTTQDGGVPHAGCACATCAAARDDPGARRLVASIAVIGASGRVLVVDATPDLPLQAARLGRDLGLAGPRLDALLLTHAHVGHYLGLAFLGREAMDAKGLPIHATPRMASFLAGNRPWSHLVDRAEVTLETIAPGTPLPFDGVAVVPFASPHRGEDTDTVGVEVVGPSRRLVYLPDTDRWTDDLVQRVRGADVALVDGTFYDANELPRREVSSVPHPLVRQSVVALAGARGRVHFTHLNHTNPLIDPAPARRPTLPPGFEVLAEGAVFAL